MRMKIVSILYDCRFLKWVIPIYHRIIGMNKFCLKRGAFCCGKTVLYKNKFQVTGNNNEITIRHGCHIENSFFNIQGSSNVIQIEENGFVNGLEVYIQGDNNHVIIGKNVFVLDDTRFYVVDGSKLVVGDGCMFSDRIDVRTTDNHSIIDLITTKRINYEENVIIGDNVWIGTRVNILKGSHIRNGCIVGAGSVVTGKMFNEHTVIAGNPAVEIKTNMDWKMERI